MIIGDKKTVVIENIKKMAKQGKYNAKVEANDPSLSPKEKEQIINRYLREYNTVSYKIKNKISKMIVSFFTYTQNRDTEIIGLENVKDIKTGAIITSNHFNPLDNTIIRKLIKKINKNRLYIVGQESNLAMKGIIGFLMNYSDIIPISDKASYIKKDFTNIIGKILEKNNFILVYPEQEMWFNYRKPRPLKRGAYYYAAKNNVPIISCFVEIRDKDKADTNEFNKVQYVLYVLKPIYPNKNKSIKENSIFLMNEDYRQKKEAYEKAYNKKLDYEFEYADIAGFNIK